MTIHATDGEPSRRVRLTFYAFDPRDLADLRALWDMLKPIAPKPAPKEG